MELQEISAGLIPEQTVQRWKDGSIIKAAKSEAMNKFNAHFGFSSNRRWYLLMARDSPATPDQYHFLIEIVDEYWALFNPSANS